MASMDTDTYNSPSPQLQQPARLMPLPSIHLHPSLSSATAAAARHPQPSTSTPALLAGPSPSLRTSTSIVEEGGRDFETITNRSSHSTSYRTTSRASTASSVGSVDGNSDDDDDQWDYPHRHSQSHSYTRHHPYQSHQSRPHHSHSTTTQRHSITTQRQRAPPLSISPSYSRRTSLYSQSHDDMTAFLRTSTSHSANASADEGSNSNSHYEGEGEGDSPVATSLSTTSSPSFTFVPGGHAHHTTSSSHGGGIPDGSPSAAASASASSSAAGRPGVGTGAGNQSGGGGQSTIHTDSNTTIHATQTASNNTTAPLSLDSLPSYPADQKPPFSYPVLIRLAILGSPQKRLLLSQIYSAIEDKFPWYRDSAPKAWKASVRHCLSLNKEFVRMQRAVEDPGVGCGGWWSVGEGMKGLKRPRKRRPAQSRRPEHELDPTAPMIKTPTSAPSPLAIRRRHSTTFEDALTAADSYSRYVSSLSSSSLPPSEGRGEVLLPPIGDYPLRLPPLQLPNIDTNTNIAHLLPTPPSSSRTVVFGAGGAIGMGGEIKREFEYPPQGHAHSFYSNYERPRGTHTPTASSSSSYSTQSYGSASSASSSGRPNPMSISSLLNERDSSTSNTVACAVTERLDKMDIDMDMETEEPREGPPRRPDHSAASPSGIPTSASASVQPKQADHDVEMQPANNADNGAKTKAKVAKVETTPFSSDQTLRPPSPASTSPQSHGRRSATPVAVAAATPKPLPKIPALTESPPVEQRHREHRDRHREKERERAPQPHGGGRHGEARPPSRSRAHAERTTPARPVRPPPPVHVHGISGSKGSTTTTRERERKSTNSGRSGKGTAKSAGAGVGASKPWANSMDLSLVEPESESD